VLHYHEKEGKWRRLAGDLEAWPTVKEAGMAREVDGTGGAIGSRAGGREIFEDGDPDGEVSASGKYRDFLFFDHNLAMAKAVTCLIS
jgi:hypothetical protein